MWMNKVLQKCKDFKSKCDKDTKKTFKAKIQSEVDHESIDAGIKELILKTAELMGVEIKKEKKRK